MKPKSKRNVILAVFFCLAAVSCFFYSRGKITASAVLAQMPKRTGSAVFFLLALYVLKSLSFFFPLAVLQTAAGAIFPIWPALILNLSGTAAAMLLPWILSSCGKENLEKLRRRFPILQKAQSLRRSGDFLYVFLLRAAGIFPFDAVSFYLGSLGIPLGKYLAAGLLGSFPQMILATVFGSGLSRAPSRFLLPLLAGSAALCAITVTICHLLNTRSKQE